MKKQSVENFLETLAFTDPDKYRVVMKLRNKVVLLSEAVGQRMMYGGIMFSLEEDLGGIFVYTNHVSFEFGKGAGFNDPDNLLEGKGKFRRHLKIKNIDDPRFVSADFFIRQMLEA